MSKSKAATAVKFEAKQAHKIAFYIRVSTEEQAENPEGSIRNQEQRLRGTVAMKNSIEGHFGDVVAVFIDRAKSGKDTNRPELQRLLSAIRRQEVNLVMASELSRLSRSIKDFSEIWELMQANGCGFLSLRENFDTTTAAGEMVLYTVANIAQFERRQVQERTSANIQARAFRGLYNGGMVPLGFKLNPDKKGYLDIDDANAEIVRRAFAVFLKEGSLTTAAKWLNRHGFTFTRQTQGGGNSPRLGHFTVQNLHNILRNKAYIGIKVYKVKDEVREARAVWQPIMDEDTFYRVQNILKKNFRRLKPKSGTRYPFPLSGIVQCAKCGERLCGKTAHGNGGKFHYYEHAWATKRQSCLVKKVFDCDPNRVLAKIIEPVVWAEIEKVLTDPKEAKNLIDEAHAVHGKKTKGDDVQRIKARVAALSSQLDALAERIAVLPTTISEAPFYKQMEKIEALKREEEARLREAELSGANQEEPASVSSYAAFLEGLRAMADDSLAQEIRKKIIHKLISRIEVQPGTFRLHFHVGSDYVDRELAHAGSRLFLCPKSATATATATATAKNADGAPDVYLPKRRQHFLSSSGSQTLDIGVHKPLHIERSS